MKKFISVILCFLSVSCFAMSASNQASISVISKGAMGADCAGAVPTSDPTFCASWQTAGSFAAATDCNCEQVYHLSHAFCIDMQAVYADLVSPWNNDLKTACDHQTTIKPDVCYADWTYYRTYC